MSNRATVRRRRGPGGVLSHLPRPEKCLALFAVVGFLFTTFALWAGTTDQAYADYYHNHVIRLIQLGASGVDLSLLLVLACSRWMRLPQWSVALPLSFLTLAGTWLTWYELWYSSTFYYGDVREEQGLPYSVNNLGVLGSFAFLSYLIWRLPLGRMPSGWSFTVRCILTALLLLGQSTVLGIVGKPWNLM